MNVIKKTLIASCLAMLAGNVMATDGTIEFTGEILLNTCQFANGDVVNVELGHYSVDQFKGVGDRSPAIPFDIPLTGCPTTEWQHVNGSTDNSFQVWLETRTNGTTGANNELVKVSGATTETTATGVGIRIDSVQHNNTQMALNKLNTPGITFTPEVDGTATVGLQAYYVATNALVTPGQANATVDVTIDYR